MTFSALLVPLHYEVTPNLYYMCFQKVSKILSMYPSEAAIP